MKKILATILLGGSLTGGVTSNLNQPINTNFTDTGTKLVTYVNANEIDISKTSPSVTLQKWNGQEKLGISVGNGSTASAPVGVSNEVDNSIGNGQTVKMDPTADGQGFNVDISLAAEPASNIFTYQFSGYDDLNFFYQPALNIEMASSTCTATDCGRDHRPDNVVGSFAVYSRNHVNHVMGQTNYETGKLFQIYRPQVTDAKGTQVWADLSYSNGILSITVPQNFLDSAVYPVVIDPTFGYTSIGASTFQTGTGSGNNNPVGLLGTLSVAGTITKISSYVAMTSTSQNQTDKLYAGSAGSLGANLKTSTATLITSSFAWSDFSFASSYSAAATTYWLENSGYGGDGPGTSVGQIKYDTGGASNTGYDKSDVGTPQYETNQYSMYATYTASASATASTTRISIPFGRLSIPKSRVSVPIN